MATGQNRPAPITAFDEFIHMAPIVEMRGDVQAASLFSIESEVMGEGCSKRSDPGAVAGEIRIGCIHHLHELVQHRFLRIDQPLMVARQAHTVEDGGRKRYEAVDSFARMGGWILQ